MLIKLSVPFVLAATVMGASVPLRRDGVALCPSQGSPANNNQMPTTGLVGVRDLTHDIVGYLAPPTDDGKLFSFTNDKTKALTANILSLDGNGANADGKYWTIKIGVPGTDSFLGATTITATNNDSSNYGFGAVNNLPASVIGNTNPSTGTSSLLTNTPPLGGAPPIVPLTNGVSVPPVFGSDSRTGSTPPPSGPPTVPSTGVDPSNAVNPPSAPAVVSPPSTPAVNAPAAVDPTSSQSGNNKSNNPLTDALSQLALGPVSSQDLSDELFSNILSDASGKHWNLQFVLDKESNQILAKKQTDDAATPQVTNWQYNDGKFCLFDDAQGANVSQNGSGNHINFFLIQP